MKFIPTIILELTTQGRQVIDPREEHTMVSLLNDYNIKPTPNDLHYSHRLRHLSGLIWEASICSRWWYSDLQLAKTQRIRDYRMLSPKWNIYASLPLKVQRLLQKRGREGGKSQKRWTTTMSSRHNSADALGNVQHAQSPCKPKTHPSMEKEVGHKTPSIDKELLTILSH